MKVLFYVFFFLSFWTGKEQSFIRKFFENPFKNRKYLDRALNILEKENRFAEAFALIDSAIKISEDRPLLYRAINLALREKDTLRLRNYLKDFVNIASSPIEVKSLFHRLYYRDKNSALKLLEFGENKWGESAFFNERYTTYLLKRDYVSAFKWLVKGLNMGFNIGFILREAERIYPFLGYRKIEQIVKPFKKTRKVHLLMAKLALLNGDLSRALEHAKKAKDIDLIFELAQNLFLKRDYKNAKSLLLSIQKKKWNDKLKLLYAQICLATGDTSEALNSLKKLKNSDYAKIKILISLGKTEYIKGLKNLPDSLKHYRAMALLFENQEQNAKAILDSLHNPAAMLLRAKIELFNGSLVKAETLLFQIAKDFPSTPQASEALFYLEIERTNGKNPEFEIFKKAGYLMLKGDYRGCINLLKGKSEPLLLFLKADCLRKQNNIPLAIGIYQELGERDSTFIGAFSLWNQAILETEIGDTTGAKETYEKLILKFPGSPYAALARSKL